MSDNIKELVQILAGTNLADKVHMFTCSVESIDMDTRSAMVKPINADFDAFPAQLMTEVDDGMLVIPSIDSTVKVIFSDLNAPTVVQFSQIDQIFLVTGDSTFKIYDSGIELMGTKYGGLMQIMPSIKAWNDLQNDVNNLKTIFNALVTAAPGILTSTPGAADAFAAAFAAAISSYAGSALTITLKSDIENTLVQHGDGT